VHPRRKVARSRKRAGAGNVVSDVDGHRERVSRRAENLNVVGAVPRSAATPRTVTTPVAEKGLL
jgi:hypothetical protein